jgi:tetratricopeptide (TPR) repeat protein
MYEETMHGWKGFKAATKDSFNFLQHSVPPSFYVVLIIINVFYFIHFIIPLGLSSVLSDSSTGVVSIFIGLFSLLCAVYGIRSSTDQLNDAQKRLSNTQKQLSEIQIDYWNTRGIDLYKEKNYREADQSYERAINLNPQDTKVWINIANSLYEQSKLEEALNAINKAIEMDQSRADSWNGKGMILRAKATNALERHIELNTELTEVRTSKYTIPFAQPIVFLENNMDLNNESSGAWDNKGEALLAQALVALEKAIELKTIELTHRPSKLAGDWLYKGFLAGVWSNIGTILDLQHKYSQAIRAYDKAIELDPKYVAAWFNRGHALISDETLKSPERLYEAIDAFNRAIELDPENVISWSGKGLALRKIAQESEEEYAKSAYYDEALHAFDKAIEFNPLYYKAWHWKGYVLFEKGHYNEAIEACDKAIDIRPHDDLNLWHNKWRSLYKLGKYDEAIKALDTTIKLYTQYALSWFNEYNKLIKLGKYDEAIEAYDRGLELYIEGALYLTAKGDAIYNTALWHPERLRDALEAYNIAITLDPFNASAWCGMCITMNALSYTDTIWKAHTQTIREAYTHANRLTLLIKQPYQYIDNFEKPIYWP